MARRNERVVERHVVLRRGDAVHDVAMLMDDLDGPTAVEEARRIAGLRNGRGAILSSIQTAPAPDATRRHRQLLRSCGWQEGAVLLVRPTSPDRDSALYATMEKATREEIDAGRSIRVCGWGAGGSVEGSLSRTRGTWSLSRDGRRTSRVRVYDGAFLSGATPFPVGDGLDLRRAVADVDRLLGKASAEGVRYTFQDHVALFGRYAGILEATGLSPACSPDDREMPRKPEKALPHVMWMCREMMGAPTSTTIDKMARWMGFVQTIMIVYGVLDVRSERDATRPVLSLSNLSVDLLSI